LFGKSSGNSEKIERLGGPAVAAGGVGTVKSTSRNRFGSFHKKAKDYERQSRGEIQGEHKKTYSST